MDIWNQSDYRRLESSISAPLPSPSGRMLRSTVRAAATGSMSRQSNIWPTNIHLDPTVAPRTSGVEAEIEDLMVKKQKGKGKALGWSC